MPLYWRNISVHPRLSFRWPNIERTAKSFRSWSTNSVFIMVHEHHMYVLRGRNSVHPTVHPSIRVLLTSIACLVGLSSMSLIFHSDHARRSFDQLSFHQRWLIFIETTIASSTLHSGCNTCWFLKLFSIKRLLHLALLTHFWNWRTKLCEEQIW